MESFRVVRGECALPLVLSCEHAGGEIPDEYDDLGMSVEQLEECRRGVDVGAEEIFDDLVTRLECWGIKNRLSRLVIDVNRCLDQESLIPTSCGGREIPGNRGLSAEDRRERVRRFYVSYHRALDRLLLDCERRHGRVCFMPIHTMEPVHGDDRREMDFCLVCNEGCWLTGALGGRLEECGYSVTVNDPFRPVRDILRTPIGSTLERFNRTAVLVEVNERHRHDEGVKRTLAAAIESAVEACDAAGSPDSPTLQNGRDEP